jgi:hypothetical protein
MKITKELFNKLSKKNQLEIKSKIDKAREIKPPMIWVTYIFWFVCFMAFMFIAIPLWKLAFGWKLVEPLLVMTQAGKRLWIFFIALGLIIDLGVLAFRLGRIDKIKREYFKIEVRDEKAN